MAEREQNEASTSRRHQASSSSPLLSLLDGVLSQDEPSMMRALDQIQMIDPTLKNLCKSPLQSSSALEFVVQRLLLAQPRLAQISSETDGSLPLHFAASIGNVRVASWLLQQHPESALCHNKKGKIPLHYAAREGRIAMVQFLLQQEPQSAAVMTHKRKLPIHFAAGDGHIDVVRALLKVNPMGASTPSKKGKVALHFAARWGHITIAEDLCNICPPCVKIQDFDGSLPLHDAAREGQLEMAQFLVQKYPQGMSKRNIRGELPLFGAIRSGNVDLCDFFIRSWPQCGKHILQIVRSEDNVESWDPAILDLCLRGAVNNFSGMPTNHEATPIFAYEFPEEKERHSPGKSGRPKVLTLRDRNNSNSSSGEASVEVAAIADFAAAFTPPSHNSIRFVRDQLTPGLDITLPRYKSPILQDDGSAQKRCAAEGTNSNKKSRRGNSMDDRNGDRPEVIRQILASQTFYQLHAALETSVSLSVLQCVIDRYANVQLAEVDDRGKLPLHIAVSRCRPAEEADLILTRILEPYRQAAFCRDYLGRLPLHLALASNFDSRVIEVLLKENPSSGVNNCEAIDPEFGEKLPLQVATESGCDLSTIYLLLKNDPTTVQSWIVDAR
ncbi:ankyrin repeat domain protein [Nitzschia inconspicua]|uniref:Ankyrin repeat domain protein n=1 Tax=Nitzschia inconspicua TaxID=303405 RepID=A0A9K3LSY9_9STRA|nr:ankyrin repeat domain protein [Nitzschia inconspicua]